MIGNYKESGYGFFLTPLELEDNFLIARHGILFLSFFFHRTVLKYYQSKYEVNCCYRIIHHNATKFNSINCISFRILYVQKFRKHSQKNLFTVVSLNTKIDDFLRFLLYRFLLYYKACIIFYILGELMYTIFVKFRSIPFSY